MIACFWLEKQGPSEDFSAMAVNRAMREAGYPTTNITRLMGKLADAGRLTVSTPATGRRRYRLSRQSAEWCRERIGTVEEFSDHP